MSKLVAVILSGCGVYDGSEIHEATAVLRSIAKLGYTYKCFAPLTKLNTVNHVTGKNDNTKRSVLEESARISRGEISPLKDLDTSKFSAVVLPGGFGAAKNLSDFAFKGTEMSVNSTLERKLNEFKNENKPIGACCIAPVILSKVFPKCKITIGNDPNVSSAIKQLGGIHEEKLETEICVDMENKFVTTPAYMRCTRIDQVFDGVDNMVKKVLELSKK
ncbi:glyoxalase elbb [Anaeramoeba flamelloides]|uniref:Glyoxalase elbb n=1 Tax=Anaeramoeba flamelloides TaxID=1746091 RepID=A0AAV7ZSI6_9EUKA|nr:glyoxalase elbb [Anaeramoeba flamelloides]KAJ6232979.1 glyoxalase elbb [Anaeramoeba flamelloides]|eukprot:Anaeramoba_flamelloidesa577185_202.p1 GENE.a577185_202~~a577185_202.p1  ORF type:complete len:218 (+),score=51.05 a577185_202:11-664(+)